VLPVVVLGDTALRQITSICAAFDVDGLRADLVTARAAIALAAWDGRSNVNADDVRTAARLALPHRRRRQPDDPFDAPGSAGIDEETLDRAIADAGPEPPPDDDPGGGRPETENPSEPTPSGQSQQPAAERPAVSPGTPYRAKLLALPTVGVSGPAGRRGRTLAAASGRTVGARPPAQRLTRLHTMATLLAAAPHQIARGRGERSGLLLERGDLRETVLEGRESNLVLFCVDASGSMAARERMRAVKTGILSLLLDAYQRRDKVGLVTFRSTTGRPDAVVALAPTSSIERATGQLAALPTGGRTPLAAGLARAARVLEVERLRDPARRPLLVVVTDGRHTRGPDPAAAAAALSARGIASVVIDCETGPVRLGMAVRLGGLLGGLTVPLAELAADGLAGVVRDVRRAA
jgi:magnesium chelatase subunit D